ncbi:hypothetical protein ACP275_06G053100 [Erythranthe tilingii]
MLRRPKIPILPHHYASVLKSCISQKSIEPGKQIHARLCLNGAVLSNVNLATQLVNLYIVCKSLRHAHHLFDRIPNPNIFLWNILIRGYAWNGPYEAAISLYRQLLDQELVPDKFTFPFALKACSALSEIDVGREIHERVRKTGWETDVFVAAALVDMYAKCGCVSESRQVFDKIADKDVVLWNSMLAAYSQNGHPEECLKLCSEMASRGYLKPTEATLVTAVSASADSSAVIQGRELHGYSWRIGFKFNDKVNTGLIDMYAKSGNVEAARVLFEGLSERRLVSWNAMITGYAMHGHAHEALHLFDKMSERIEPDQITFVGVLSACNHGGLIDEGRMRFDSMVNNYGIKPNIQHYTCMVDLLGHSNCLDEAYSLVMKMNVAPDCGVWGALLNSCKIHKNVEMGEFAFERLIEMGRECSGSYVIMSNIYAQAGKWEGVAKVRKSIRETKSIKKSVGCSWVEVRGKVHAFVCGDNSNTSHPMWDDISAELNELGGLIAGAGYIANVSPVFYDVESDEKAEMVRWHSERVAVAFGLISTPAGSKLLITKNLRICEDCHVAVKIVSRVKGREIVVRDVNRYHRFVGGVCSCGDFW